MKTKSMLDVISGLLQSQRLLLAWRFFDRMAIVPSTQQQGDQESQWDAEHQQQKHGQDGCDQVEFFVGQEQ